jgi:uncharacterized protein (DUF305 family)
MRRLLLTLFAAAVLAACGGNDPSGSGGAQQAPQPNDADVAFAQAMIPHHREATKMAGLVADRTERTELRTLAGNIVKTQSAEITTMEGWLRDWGRSVTPEGSMPGMEAGGHAGSMMDPADMKMLEGLSGAEFDLKFIDMMIEHHTSAIEMAKTEQRDGSLPEVKELAGDVIRDQQREIDQMTAWREAWAS